MSDKIYVGNLSYKAQESDLEDLFAPFGDIVEAKVIRERDSDRSRGFGFVTFASADEATKSLDLNGTELQGRALNIKLAENTKPRTGHRDER